MDYHVLTPDGAILIHSDNMATQARKTKEQIDAERRESILKKKRIVPNGSCHYCGFTVPKLAHWCCSECANLYAEEKERLVL